MARCLLGGCYGVARCVANVVLLAGWLLWCC